MVFSGAVKLGDLNDFIAPSQACVVNLAPKSKLDAIELQVDTVQLPPTKKDPKGFQQTQLSGDAVKVSLQDCLACSGCVTSAETVLLEHQSTGELLSALLSNKTVIVSVSPQSRSSLGVLHQLSPSETAGKLVHFLKSVGVSVVLDTTSSRDIALLEAAQEFITRYTVKHTEHAAAASSGAAAPMNFDQDERQQSHAQAGPSNTSDTQSNGSATNNMSSSQIHHGSARGAEQEAGPLPMLASACPGWVCYAEKTHGSYILPYISTTKSPQAVMGTLVKRFLGQQMGLEPGAIYHCAVMPCYDKKLEGSREDFCIPGTNVPEVDSVLTTSEVQQLIEQQGLSFADLPCAPLDSLLGPGCTDDQLHNVHGGSGGYLEFIFRTAAQQLFHRQLPSGPLPMKTLRNADFTEISLDVEGRTVLRFAAAYGFRNIQTLVRKIKRKACEYDYVEVMACPSGCLNGGGQIKAHKGQTPQQLLDELDQHYHAAELVERHPGDNAIVPLVYKQFVGGRVYNAAARDCLHTSYHHREKSVSAMIGDW